MLIFILFILIAMVIGFTGIVKAPPNKAIIITGLSKKPRVIIDRVGWHLLFIERVDKIIISAFSVEIGTDSPVPTRDYQKANITAVMKLQVDITDPKILERAYRNFLNKTKEEIKKGLEKSLQGNLREIIGTLELEKLYTNREVVAEAVKNNATSDMQNLGLQIVSCNIMQVVLEDEKVIDDLAEREKSRIRLEAEIQKAETEKQIRIEQARKEEEANAEVSEKQKSIAKTKNELRLLNANLEKEAAEAEAEAKTAYDLKMAQLGLEIDRIVQENDDMVQSHSTERYKSRKIAEAEGMMAISKAKNEASTFEQNLAYLEKCADITKAVAEPLSKTEKVVMYGEGNSSNLIRDVMTASNQVVEGIREGGQIDLPRIMSKK